MKLKFIDNLFNYIKIQLFIVFNYFFKYETYVTIDNLSGHGLGNMLFIIYTLISYSKKIKSNI